VLPRLRIHLPSILRDLIEVAVAVAIGMGFGYRIDDRTLAELLAGHPELAAGLAAIAAARRAALEAQAGGSSAPAAGRRAAEPTAGLIQRLLGR